MARSPTINISFTGDSRDAQKAVKDVEQSLGGFGDKVTSVGDIAKGVFTATAVTGGIKEIGGFLKDSAQAAADDEASMRQLAETMRNSTDASDEQIASVEKFIHAQQQATGVLDDQLRPAFANVLRATKDTTKAQELLRISQDIAASTGRDLESVSLAVAKAYDGNIGGLSRLGISMKDANGEALSWDAAQAQLNATFGGAAQAAAETTAGKMAILKAQFEDFKENVGAKVIPIVLGFANILTGDVIPAIKATSDWIKDHKELVLAAAIGIATVLVPAFIAWAVSAGAAAVATLTAAAPVIAIGVVVAALAAGIIWLYQNVDIFRNSVDAVASFLRDNGIPILKIAGEVLLAMATGGLSLIITRWDELRGILGWVGDKFSWVKDVIDGVSGAFSWLIGRVVDLIDTLTHIDWPSPPGWLTGRLAQGIVSGGLSEVVRVAPHAAGGIFRTPHIGMVAESGPEAIIPLSRVGALGGGIVIQTLNVSTWDAASAPAAARAIQAEFLKLKRDNGPGALGF